MIKMRLVHMLSHAKKYIIFQVIWQWLALLCQIMIVYCIAILLETALFWEVSFRMGAGYAAAILLAAVFRFYCDRQACLASGQAGMNVKRILRDHIYAKILHLGAAYKESIPTAEAVQMAGEGVEQLEVYFGKYLPQLFYSLLAPLTLFAALLFVDWRAALVLLLCVPLIPLSIVAVQKIAKKLLDKYWKIYTGLGDSFLENLQGLTTLKIYQADGKKAEEMDEESQQFRRITMKVLTMQLNSTSVMDIIAYGSAAAGMLVALLEFGKGNIGVANTLLIILLAAEFFIPLRLLGSFFHIAMNGMAASDKIFALLDLPEPEEKNEKADIDAFSVYFRETVFSYEPEKEILKGISMQLPEGKFVSLAGVSGCGKSTVASILTGKNKGYKGSVCIGNKELSRISEAELFKLVTLVRHDSYLFKGTVEDNLRMGKKDASWTEMEEALSKVNLWEFLQEMEGVKTKVMERGSNFSGGQRQRLAIARALLHDTPIYIFDEATSNIDVESEEMIMSVIRGLAKEKTVLLISHRLANVVESDRIYMLEDGKVAEEGTHTELMKKKGIYEKLYRYQRELEACREETAV